MDMLSKDGDAMDIQDQITRLQGAKDDLVEASDNFELDVPQPQKIDTYAKEILKYSRLQNSGYQQDYGNTLSVSIPATTHGQGTSPFVDVYYLENGNLIKMSAYPENGHKVEIASNGDVTVTFPVLTSGRIFVIGKKTVTGIEPASGVESFNGRTGAVIPQNGDYTAAMVGAVTDTDVTNKLNAKVTYGTTDLTAGTSALETGVVYLVYE